MRVSPRPTPGEFGLVGTPSPCPLPGRGLYDYRLSASVTRRANAAGSGGMSPSWTRARSSRCRRPRRCRHRESARSASLRISVWRGFISSTGGRPPAPARAAQQPLHLQVRAVLPARQHHGAVDQPVGRTHVGDLLAQRLLQRGQQRRHVGGLALPRASAASFDRSAAPWVTLRSGLPSKLSSRSGQKASMGSESSSTSDAPRAEALELRRVAQRVGVVADQDSRSRPAPCFIRAT